MKQLSTLNIARLRTEECFGYLKQVKAETANLPSEEPPAAQTAATTTFDSGFNAFDDALKASSTNPATATATATDDARDAAWRGANNYLTAMCAHPTAEVAANAAEAKSLFDKYGDPTKLAQTEESGVLHNLLQDLDYRLENERRSVPCRCRRTHGSRCCPSGGHREGNPHRCRSRLSFAGRYGQCLGDDKRRHGIRHVY